MKILPTRNLWISSFSLFGLIFVFQTAFCIISIDTGFESANITSVSLESTNVYSMQLRNDTNATDKQWFYFRVTGANGQSLTFRITNAGSSNVPNTWNYLRPVQSSDLDNWSHITNKSYNSGVFQFTHLFTSDTVFIAYYYPYTFTRLENYLDSITSSNKITRETLTFSVQGRKVDLLKITDPLMDDMTKKGIWVVARQHGAETPGSWNCEGLIDYLLSGDSIANELIKKTVWNIVPMMNPDGVVAGNYRENILGINLNRVWNSPSPVSSPSVYEVLSRISSWNENYNFDLFVDLHAASGLHKNFLYCAHSSLVSPSYYSEQEKFIDLMEMINNEFTDSGSVRSRSSSERLSRQRIIALYGIQAYIYEMTYLYPNYGPYNGQYMTIERNKALGADLAIAVYEFFFGNKDFKNWNRYNRLDKNKIIPGNQTGDYSN